jgi:hypothetical protein
MWIDVDTRKESAGGLVMSSTIATGTIAVVRAFRQLISVQFWIGHHHHHGPRNVYWTNSCSQLWQEKALYLPIPIRLTFYSPRPCCPSHVLSNIYTTHARLRFYAVATIGHDCTILCACMYNFCECACMYNFCEHA